MRGGLKLFLPFLLQKNKYFRPAPVERQAEDVEMAVQPPVPAQPVHVAAPQPPAGFGQAFSGDPKKTFWAIRHVGDSYTMPLKLLTVTVDPWIPTDLARMILNVIDDFEIGETYLCRVFYVNYCDHHDVNFQTRLAGIRFYSLFTAAMDLPFTENDLKKEAREFRELSFSVNEVRKGHKAVVMKTFRLETRL